MYDPETKWQIVVGYGFNKLREGIENSRISVVWLFITLF